MTVLRNEDSEKGRQRQQTLKKTERQRRLQWVRRKRRGKEVKVFGGKYDIWIVHSNFDNWGDNCITVNMSLNIREQAILLVLVLVTTTYQ